MEFDTEDQVLYVFIILFIRFYALLILAWKKIIVKIGLVDIMTDRSFLIRYSFKINIGWDCHEFIRVALKLSNEVALKDLDLHCIKHFL